MAEIYLEPANIALPDAPRAKRRKTSGVTVASLSRRFKLGPGSLNPSGLCARDEREMRWKTADRKHCGGISGAQFLGSFLEGCHKKGVRFPHGLPGLLEGMEERAGDFFDVVGLSCGFWFRMAFGPRGLIPCSFRSRRALRSISLMTSVIQPVSRAMRRASGTWRSR
jgi:hypothetical protein